MFNPSDHGHVKVFYDSALNDLNSELEDFIANEAKLQREVTLEECNLGEKDCEDTLDELKATKSIENIPTET